MKKMTAALALAISAFCFSAAPAQAQLMQGLQFQRPLNYRFPVMPRSHVFNYNRNRHHAHRHHRRAQSLPLLRGPAIIYRNGDIGIPPERVVTEPAVPVIAHPVVHRIGDTGGCEVEHLKVRGSQGHTTVNVWRC